MKNNSNEGFTKVRLIWGAIILVLLSLFGYLWWYEGYHFHLM